MGWKHSHLGECEAGAANSHCLVAEDKWEKINREVSKIIWGWGYSHIIFLKKISFIIFLKV